MIRGGRVDAGSTPIEFEYLAAGLGSRDHERLPKRLLDADRSTDTSRLRERPFRRDGPVAASSKVPDSEIEGADSIGGPKRERLAAVGRVRATDAIG